MEPVESSCPLCGAHFIDSTLTAVKALLSQHLCPNTIHLHKPFESKGTQKVYALVDGYADVAGPPDPDGVYQLAGNIDGSMSLFSDRSKALNKASNDPFLHIIEMEINE